MKTWFHILALAGTVLIAGCNSSTDKGGESGSAGGSGLKIAVMPKLVGIDYFNAVEQGAKEAAKELGAELIWDGPVEGDVAKQAEMLDTWIARGVDAIAVAPNDPNALAPTLEKARERGIPVITFDADSTADSRDYFVNQATAESIGTALADEMANQIGGAGEVAVVTGSMTADNQNQWIKAMEARMKVKYPDVKIVTIKPSEENQQLATQVTTDLIKAYPNLKGVYALTSVAFPGAALAVNQAGKSGKIAVVGLSSPKSMAEYVNNGTVKTVILWNPVDLGYLTVQVANALAKDEKIEGAIKAGRLGEKKTSDTIIVLGDPMRFNKDNIGQFDF